MTKHHTYLYTVTIVTTLGKFTLLNVSLLDADQLCRNLVDGRPLEFDHYAVRYCIPAAQILCLSRREG